MDNNVPTMPMKHHEIDVNRQFNLHTTDSISFSGEAPPIYQQYQPVDGFVTRRPQEPQTPWESETICPPKSMLRTVVHTPCRPANCEVNLARQSDGVRRSLQLPRVETASNNNGHPLNLQAIEDAPVGHTPPHETTVLCELTGASMNFTQPDESMPGKMGMTKGASTCTIRVTLRKKYSIGGGIRTRRSIWVIADDSKICIQHKLPQGSVIIPYTLWSNEVKVIIHHPTELRFFADSNSEKPHRTTKTSWVNYAFDTVLTSADFQSALLSPLQLVRTLPTTRTLRLHKSPFVRTFSPRLQLCGLENLRVFRDATDPNCLVCMIHYSPNFRPLNGEEYIMFRLYPPPRNSVRIREDAERCVKIKGLDIRGSPAIEQKKKGRAPVSQTEQIKEEAYRTHNIEKIKIEFESGKEKRQFLEMTRELQGLSSW
ncbi:MAG: hypothetical protein Q9188_000354 [Gyalolechia gomerana]